MINVAGTRSTIAEEIERYLRTGQTDPYSAAWPGSVLEQAQRASFDLREALIRKVLLLAEGRSHHPIPDMDFVALTRARVAPMVGGLFPRAERDTVLSMLEGSVVFITSTNIEDILRGCTWAGTAWTLANLYLGSVGAKGLGKDDSGVVGLSQATTCYVSPAYFSEQDPFADFIVHEAAHVFHNCKRVSVGLRETRTREWLLNIDYGKRETFAYACEAYACVLRRAKGPTERQALADDFGSSIDISEELVDPAEVSDIVRQAARARNGWQVIFSRCAPARKTILKNR